MMMMTLRSMYLISSGSGNYCAIIILSSAHCSGQEIYKFAQSTMLRDLHKIIIFETEIVHGPLLWSSSKFIKKCKELI